MNNINKLMILYMVFSSLLFLLYGLMMVGLMNNTKDILDKIEEMIKE